MKNNEPNFSNVFQIEMCTLNNVQQQESHMTFHQKIGFLDVPSPHSQQHNNNDGPLEYSSTSLDSPTNSNLSPHFPTSFTEEVCNTNSNLFCNFILFLVVTCPHKVNLVHRKK